jgi:hypothetical protein
MLYNFNIFFDILFFQFIFYRNIILLKMNIHLLIMVDNKNIYIKQNLSLIYSINFII